MPSDLYEVPDRPAHLYTRAATRNSQSGGDAATLERFKIREICEGYPLYRDVSDWENFRAIFHDDAYVATSVSEGLIDDHIALMQRHKAAQKKAPFYVIHHVLGQAVELQNHRAVSQMKVFIVARTEIDGVEVDCEVAARMFFLLEKRNEKWGIVFFTALYESDKIIPVNPSNRSFQVPEEEVQKFPAGYRYLCWIESKLGMKAKVDLDSHGPGRDILYSKCKDWLEGRKVRPNLTGQDIDV
ncbi:PEP2-like protein [Paramyrothecium foliicola]|nr:PEP2-like protein [Paramyrothecium foliicola]